MNLKTSEFKGGGSTLRYVAPTLEIIEIRVEAGFAASSMDYSDEGYAGKDLFTFEYGEGEDY